MAIKCITMDKVNPDFIEWAQDNLQLVPAHRVDAVVKLFKKTSQFNHQPLYVADFETKGEQV